MNNGGSLVPEQTDKSTDETTTNALCERKPPHSRKKGVDKEIWSRIVSKVICGDFLQLTPVPMTLSLLYISSNHSYEHQQGHALLSDKECDDHFKQMKRFNEELIMDILQGMREPAGRKLSNETWETIKQTVLSSPQNAGRAFDRASEPVMDPKVAEIIGWYTAAHEGTIQNFPVQFKARPVTKCAKMPLLELQAITRAALEIPAADNEDMLTEAKVSKTTKLLRVLPIRVGMDMILTETIKQPRRTPGTEVEVTGLELHPRLRHIPLCIYVKAKDTPKNFHD